MRPLPCICTIKVRMRVELYGIYALQTFRAGKEKLTCREETLPYMFKTIRFMRLVFPSHQNTYRALQNHYI